MDSIRQEIPIEANGLIEIRSPDLHVGDIAEVLVHIRRRDAGSEDRGDSQENWQKFLGSLGGGDSGGSDNESIDRDLAASYLDSHDPEE